MPERKRRDDLNSNLASVEDDLLKNGSIELGDGCSISFSNAEEAPTIYVKTYGEVDFISLKRKLEQNYPGARIQGLSLKTPPHVYSKEKRKTSNKKSHK